MAVFKSDDKKEAMAAEFVKYLISAEVSINTSLKLGYIPYTHSQFELDYVKELLADPRHQVVLDQTQYIRGEGINPVDATVWNTMTKLISEIEADPDLDLDGKLTSFQKDVDEFIKMY